MVNNIISIIITLFAFITNSNNITDYTSVLFINENDNKYISLIKTITIDEWLSNNKNKNKNDW